MKKLIILLLISFCFYQSGDCQKAKKPKTYYYLQAGVGMMYDRDNVFDEQILMKVRSKDFIFDSGAEYFGVAPITFGISKILSERISDFYLEWIDISSDIKAYNYWRMDTVQAQRITKSLTFQYYTSVLKYGNKNVFYLGPNVGGGYYTKVVQNDHLLSSYPIGKRYSCICYNIDVRAMYQFVIHKDWRVNLSTKFVVFDIGYHLERTMDPNLPPKAQLKHIGFKTEFWRNQYPLTLGVSYRIK